MSMGNSGQRHKLLYKSQTDVSDQSHGCHAYVLLLVSILHVCSELDANVLHQLCMQKALG